MSDAALEVLQGAKGLHDGSGIVFPSPLRAGRPLSDMTLTKVLRDVGLAERATSIFDWIEIFYNRTRRHSSLGNISPAEFE